MIVKYLPQGEPEWLRTLNKLPELIAADGRLKALVESHVPKKARRGARKREKVTAVVQWGGMKGLEFDGGKFTKVIL